MENGLDGGVVQAWIYSSLVFAIQLDALKTLLKEWMQILCLCLQSYWAHNQKARSNPEQS